MNRTTGIETLEFANANVLIGAHDTPAAHIALWTAF
jgi:hypothetical protein